MEHDLLQVIPAGGRGHYRLVGELDLGEGGPGPAGPAGRAGGRDGPRLDLSGLSFMDSQGVRLLIDLGAMARSRGLAVVVERLSPAARRALEVTLSGVEFLR